MRGEYEASTAFGREAVELPPRARRIPHNYYDDKVPLGTTSACAENTSDHWQRFHASRNYLRVRGEYDDNYSDGP